MGIDTKEIKKNVKLQIDSQPYTVIDFQHVKPGKGNAFTRCKLKNLMTGQVLERTFKSGETLEEPNVEFKAMQYLYAEGDMLQFMDNANYEQLSLQKNVLGDNAAFLTDNMEVSVLFYNEKPINVELPTFVLLPIEYCEPGFKGDTATGGSKPARLSGGHMVQVPLHLKEGDLLKIDTRTGEYVEKVNR